MTITRDMILGARLTEIRQTYKLVDGLDERQTYFTCDRGFSFMLPVAGQLWQAIEIPAEASHLPERQTISSFLVKRTWWGGERFIKEPDTEDESVFSITQAIIVAVQCGPFDIGLGFHYPWDAELVLNNGYRVSCNVVAPHGTGSAGLHILPPDIKADDSKDMVDYFEIPLERDDSMHQIADS